jgi:hypothetical protein
MKTLKKILAIFVCVSLVSTTLVDTSIVQATEIFNNENENISEESVNNDLSSGRNSEDVALDTTEDSEATTTEVTVEDNTEEEATTETTTETVTEGETEQEVPVNGVYLSYYDEDEINDLLFTEWAFGLTEEETTRAFGMTMEDFVAFRKATKAKKWSEEGYLESLVLAEVIELSSDEDFREWVTDEQLETCFGMDRETFETLSDSGISFVEEVIDRQMAVSGGGALSGRVFYSNYSAN